MLSFVAAWKMPINITQESYDKVKQVGQGPNSIRKYKKPRLDGPLLNKDLQLLGLEEGPIVVSNPDPPPPDKQPKILFSGINPRKHAKVYKFYICSLGIHTKTFLYNYFLISFLLLLHFSISYFQSFYPYITHLLSSYFHLLPYVVYVIFREFENWEVLWLLVGEMPLI